VYSTPAKGPAPSAHRPHSTSPPQPHALSAAERSVGMYQMASCMGASAASPPKPEAAAAAAGHGTGEPAASGGRTTPLGLAGQQALSIGSNNTAANASTRSFSSLRSPYTDPSVGPTTPGGAPAGVSKPAALEGAMLPAIGKSLMAGGSGAPSAGGAGATPHGSRVAQPHPRTPVPGAAAASAPSPAGGPGSFPAAPGGGGAGIADRKTRASVHGSGERSRASSGGLASAAGVFTLSGNPFRAITILGGRGAGAAGK